MSQNRCGYRPCSAVLSANGLSLYWCNETCMTNWTKAQQGSAGSPGPAAPAPTSTPSAPLPARPAAVVVDEAARIPNHALAAGAELFRAAIRRAWSAH